jgi:hypothetical protein
VLGFSRYHAQGAYPPKEKKEERNGKNVGKVGYVLGLNGINRGNQVEGTLRWLPPVF